MTSSTVARVALCLAALALSACSDSDAAPGGDGESGNAGNAGVSGAASGGKSSSSGGSGGQASAGKSSGGKSSGGNSSSGAAGKDDGGEAGGGKGGGGTPIEGCDEPPSAAPEMKWVNATGNLAKMASECGNMGLVSAQPCSNRVIAGIAQKGLWETLDGGKTWSALGGGAGSDKITNRVSSIVYDPTDPKTFWESGIYNGAGVYKTTDSGQTFEQLGDVAHCDSVSVDFGDPERQTILAGSHETNTKLNLSKDGGKTWTNIAAGLPGGQCTATAVIDSKTFLVGCFSNPLTIVRSENSGSSWDQVPGSGLGGLFQPLIASDGTIYWPGGGGGISKSDDQGKSFTAVATPNEAPGIIAPAQITELPDGRVVVVGKDHLLASADQGQTWAPLGDKLPFPGGGYDGARGVTYSALTKTFFIWFWDCSDAVPDNAIMSMGFDWETN